MTEECASTSGRDERPQEDPRSFAGGVNAHVGGLADLLNTFLDRLRVDARESARWGDISLRVTSYLHEALPPLDLVTSVRAIVLTTAGVVVLHNPDEAHVLPGGRLEEGEDLNTTLRREVREETGCILEDPLLIGFIHFEHLTPEPEGYAYPYPHFLQVVYAARGEIVSEAADPTGWEQRVEFVPVEDVRNRSFPETQGVFLQEGLRILGAFTA